MRDGGDRPSVADVTDELALRRVSDTLFTATAGDVQVARCSVALGDGVWEVYSTVTTPGHERRGYASRLVEFVLQAADAAGVVVIPSCWYVDGWMQRHSPRFDHLRSGHVVDQAGSDEDPQCRIAPVVLPTTPAQQ
jgi:hypothetical protein